jgi:hypothetical protein
MATPSSRGFLSPLARHRETPRGFETPTKALPSVNLGQASQLCRTTEQVHDQDHDKHDDHGAEHLLAGEGHRQDEMQDKETVTETHHPLCRASIVRDSRRKQHLEPGGKTGRVDRKNEPTPAAAQKREGKNGADGDTQPPKQANADVWLIPVRFACHGENLDGFETGNKVLAGEAMSDPLSRYYKHGLEHGAKIEEPPRSLSLVGRKAGKTILTP